MKASFLSELVALFNTCLALGTLSFNFAFCEAFPATQSLCRFLIWVGLALWICGAPNGASESQQQATKVRWFRPKCIGRCQELICLHRGLTLKSPRNTEQLQPAPEILTAGYSQGHLLVPGNTEQINPGSYSSPIRQEPLNREFMTPAGAWCYQHNQSILTPYTGEGEILLFSSLFTIFPIAQVPTQCKTKRQIWLTAWGIWTSVFCSSVECGLRRAEFGSICSWSLDES